MTSFGRVGIAIDIAVASVLFACLVVSITVVVFASATVFLTFFLSSHEHRLFVGLFLSHCLDHCDLIQIQFYPLSLLYSTFLFITAFFFFFLFLDNVKTAMLSLVLIESVILRNVFRRKYRDSVQSAVIWKILSRTRG